MLKREVINEMKKYFDGDLRRIDHANRVTGYAEQLINLTTEQDINKEVVIYSAILHDIGIKNAEKKYGSAAGKYQEIEGPPLAREILLKLKINTNIIDEVCEIIGHHHSPGIITTMNFKLLYDADWLVNLPETASTFSDQKKLAKTIIKIYLTEQGKEFAEKLFL